MMLTVPSGDGELTDVEKLEEPPAYDPRKFHYEMIRSELEEVVGEGHISTRDSDRFVYSSDWFWLPQMWLDRGHPMPLPDYIVHPGSPEEIAAVLRIANAYNIPVIPWGGGSGTQGSAVALYGGIILDLKRLDQIIEINEQAMTVTAQAGINGTQLEWALNEKGFMLRQTTSRSDAASSMASRPAQRSTCTAPARGSARTTC
jgi:alkyldihydroxyacetonephosphate synthase